MGNKSSIIKKNDPNLFIIEYYDSFYGYSDIKVLRSIWLYFNDLFSLKMSMPQVQMKWGNNLLPAIKFAINWLEARPHLGSDPDKLCISRDDVYRKLIKVSQFYSV